MPVAPISANLVAMTTTDIPAPQSPPRVLRRSTTDRVGAGVAGGLGAYFGVDPVLFRVLFAVAAFFGGAGILAYLLAWAVIPEEGSERAGIDDWIGELRRRRVPVWAVAVAAGLLLWVVSFSWWLPSPAFPLVAVVALILVLTLRPGGPRPAPADPVTTGRPVDLTKPQPAAPPRWRTEGRAWIAEAKAARRERRRRAWPVKIATVLALITALGVLGIVDAAGRVAIPLYFWTAAAVVGAGLLVGLVARRTPWSLLPLLAVALAGGIASSPTSASWSDGVGDRTWQPTDVPASSYRLAVGNAVLDLRNLPQQTTDRTIDVEVAVGQVRVLVPGGLPVTVDAHVQYGAIIGSGPTASGIGVDRTVTLDGTGSPVTVDVHLTDGTVNVVRS
jgi:phage shock protein PspC (stress-responsive transcriptional regulator)